MHFWKKHTGTTRATISDEDHAKLPEDKQADFEKHEPYHEEEPTHTVTQHTDDTWLLNTVVTLELLSIL